MLISLISSLGSSNKYIGYACKKTMEINTFHKKTFQFSQKKKNISIANTEKIMKIYWFVWPIKYHHNL